MKDSGLLPEKKKYACLVGLQTALHPWDSTRISISSPFTTETGPRPSLVRKTSSYFFLISMNVKSGSFPCCRRFPMMGKTHEPAGDTSFLPLLSTTLTKTKPSPNLCDKQPPLQEWWPCPLDIFFRNKALKTLKGEPYFCHPKYRLSSLCLFKHLEEEYRVLVVSWKLFLTDELREQNQILVKCTVPLSQF